MSSIRAKSGNILNDIAVSTNFTNIADSYLCSKYLVLYLQVTNIYFEISYMLQE